MSKAMQWSAGEKALRETAADNPLHNPCVYQLVTIIEQLPGYTIQNHMHYNTFFATS